MLHVSKHKMRHKKKLRSLLCLSEIDLIRNSSVANTLTLNLQASTFTSFLTSFSFHFFAYMEKLPCLVEAFVFDWLHLYMN